MFVVKNDDGKNDHKRYKSIYFNCFLHKLLQSEAVSCHASESNGCLHGITEFFSGVHSLGQGTEHVYPMSVIYR